MTDDHKAEAVTPLYAGRVGNAADGAWATAIATEALVHATLYAAEQQRIANVIALGKATHLAPDPTVPGHMMVAVLPEIAAALGLNS